MFRQLQLWLGRWPSLTLIYSRIFSVIHTQITRRRIFLCMYNVCHVWCMYTVYVCKQVEDSGYLNIKTLFFLLTLRELSATQKLHFSVDEHLLSLLLGSDTQRTATGMKEFCDAVKFSDGEIGMCGYFFKTSNIN